MQIVDFIADCIKVVVEIARQNYEEERGYVHALPSVDTLPDLKPYADNGLGIEISHCMDYEFVELSKKEYSSVYQFDQFLNQHQCESPFFMNRKPDSLREFIKSYEECNSRFFAAKHNGKICAYLKILKDGDSGLNISILTPIALSAELMKIFLLLRQHSIYS